MTLYGAPLRGHEWLADPVRPPETDEEPWTPAAATLPEPRAWSMLGLEDLAGWYAVAVAVVAAALLALLALIGIRRVAR